MITNSDRNTTGLLVSVSDHALVISTVNGTQTFTSGEVIRVTPLGDHFAPDAGTYGTTRKYRAQKSERAATAWAFWDGLAIAGLIITPCAAGAFVLIPAVFVGPWTLLVSIPVAVALLGLAGYQAWRYFGASASRAEAAKRLSSSEEAMAY